MEEVCIILAISWAGDALSCVALCGFGGKKIRRRTTKWGKGECDAVRADWRISCSGVWSIAKRMSKQAGPIFLTMSNGMIQSTQLR